MINDDKPFVSVSGGTAFVHGSPWSGDKWLNTNKKSPLKAICLLERDERNHIERAALSEIFPRLLGVFFRGETPEQLKRSLDLFDEIAECCNFYRLGCNMEDEAAVIAYTYMKENNK